MFIIDLTNHVEKLRLGELCTWRFCFSPTAANCWLRALQKVIFWASNPGLITHSLFLSSPTGTPVNQSIRNLMTLKYGQPHVVVAQHPFKATSYPCCKLSCPMWLNIQLTAASCWIIPFSPACEMFEYFLSLKNLFKHTKLAFSWESTSISIPPENTWKSMQMLSSLYLHTKVPQTNRHIHRMRLLTFQFTC